MLWLKKNAHILLSIVFVAFTVTVFAPIELYYTNYQEFWFTRKDVLLVSGFLAVGCIAFFFLVGLLLAGIAREFYSCILFTVGILLYIQGNFANLNYGILDGKAIDWGAYPVYAVLDTTGWCLGIAGAIYLWIHRRDFFHKVQKTTCVFLITVQIVTLLVLFFTTDSSVFEKSDDYLSSDGIYEVSSKENILVFVLDAFDDVYFQELLKEEPKKYQNMFKGFTHFKNASAGGAATKIALPAIITGAHYPGKVSYPAYIEQEFDRDGLYSALRDDNYDIRFYTKSSFIPDHKSSIVNNQVSTGYKVASYTGLAQTYGTLVLYRYVPHILKRFFWLYTGEFDQYQSGSSAKEYIIDDAAYFSGLMENGLTVNEEKSIFRLVHLNGAHPPYQLNEYAEEVGEDHTSSEMQRKGALHILENYIEKLKQLGLYEDDTIIVMADHGQKNMLEHGLLLVKKSGQKEEEKEIFVESNLPVSYFDLHAAIFDVLGMEQGKSFEETADTNRERHFYFNDTKAGKMRIVEYAVDTDINQKNAIHETGTVYSPDVLDVRYQYGTLLTFGADNTAADYIVSGISSTDMADFSWTDGKECEFQMQLERMPKGDLSVSMDILTVYDRAGAQRVKIYANEEECYSDTLSSGGVLEFNIPGSVVKNDKKLILRIELPDAVIPAQLLGEGNDTRMLALAIRGLQIEQEN